MRKPQDFVVYPRDCDRAPVVVQSDRAIGQFDPCTGEGVLNWRGSNEKFFRHLARSLGAESYQFSAEFVARAISNEPMPSEEIGPGIYIANEGIRRAGRDVPGASQPTGAARQNPRG